MPTETPQLPDHLAEIDLSDPDTYREGIRGMFWTTYELTSDLEGIDVPSAEEIIRFQQDFRFADEVLDVEVERSWVHSKKYPDDPPALTYRYYNHWYDGPGERWDYIHIPFEEVERFTEKVRFVNSERERIANPCEGE